VCRQANNECSVSIRGVVTLRVESMSENITAFFDCCGEKEGTILKINPFLHFTPHVDFETSFLKIQNTFIPDFDVQHAFVLNIV
jgi:hypothetical protein